VPVIHAAQSLSILEIAAELQRLQALGAAGRLGEAELTGGTFTLSNIGSIGGTYASPVILTPQVSCIPMLLSYEHSSAVGVVVSSSSWCCVRLLTPVSLVRQFVACDVQQ
jgi:pyruvate/2-oxoglutarate dehydrogenase complex dihydrolipoamide acyltransferase (E2) component